MVETNVSKLGSKVRVTEDDIPGAKLQMNENLDPCNGLRRVSKVAD